MTDNADPLEDTKGAVKNCAECGEPTIFEFLDPFDKAKDRPLCLKCLEREIGLPVDPNENDPGTVDPHD
jgi:hypothetical protein